MPKFKKWLVWIPIALFFIEYFAYNGFGTLIQNLPDIWPLLLKSVYLILSVAAYYLIFIIGKIREGKVLQKSRNFLLVFFVGFYLAKIIVALPIFVDFIVRLGQYLMSLSRGAGLLWTDIPYSFTTALVAWIIGGLVWLLMLSGMLNRYRYKVRTVPVYFKDLPESFDGLKLLQFSDLHAGSITPPEKITKGVDLILRQEADMILFTGDLVNNKAKEIEPFKEQLSRLKAPLGVYAVTGNHDYGDYINWEKPEERKENLTDFRKSIREMGWHLMNNEHKNFRRGEDEISLMGVSNWSDKKHFKKYGSMAKAYAGLKRDKPDFKILMSHDPSHWDAEIRTKYPDVDLTLSGHTHGMQFGIRLGKWQWSPIQYMYKQWAGLYQKDGSFLYVNVGFGHLGYPGRIGMRPEITVLVLHRK